MPHQDKHGLDHDDHPDVNIVSPSDGQVLTYDNASGKWINSDPAGGTPEDVSCRAYATGTHTPASGAWQVHDLGAETYDTHSMHDLVTNNSRVTVPTGKGGKYLIVGQVGFASNATGARRLNLYKNGSISTVWRQIQAINGAPTQVLASDIQDLVPGDYFELICRQDSGGSLATQSGSAATYLILIRLN